MGFNISSFTKSVTKSPVGKLVNSSLDSTGSNFASKLAASGLSGSSINDIAKSAINSITSGAATEFFNKTAVARAAVNDITNGRFASFLDATQYSTSVNPENKINDYIVDSGNSLTFPSNLGEYYLGFAFMDYERPSPFYSAKEINSFGVYLPIPVNLMETHSTSWSETSFPDGLETLGRAAAGRATGSTVESAAFANKGAITSVVGGVTETVLGMAGQGGADVGKSINNALGSEGVQGLIGQYAGAIPNPNLSILFQGPTLRQMVFNWRFHPHSPDESDKIRTIVNEFRKRTLPNMKYSGASNVLGYPQMVEVKLYPDDYLYKMKKCVVTSINVNYAPTGVPEFFKGTKAAKFIDFTVNLQEIEYFLSEDYGGSSGNGLGLGIDSTIDKIAGGSNV